MKNLRFLITNDDGIMGKGLKPLIKEISKIGSTVAVVPQAEASASSHALSLHKALRLMEIEENIFIVNGTPADCVRLGILYIMKEKVDMVISGINAGPNIAEDVIYSGTVAGARESAMIGVPSIAISLVRGKGFDKVAKISAKVVKEILKIKIPEGVYFNVNIPHENPKGIKFTFLGKRIYGRKVTVRKDPRGKSYYWIAGEKLGGFRIRGSDYNAIMQGYISVSPLTINQTDFSFLKILNERFQTKKQF